jgi:trans-aconitate methyltransferase
VSFEASWLDLREPADRAARDASLLAAAADRLRSGPSPVAVDLGCGTGATCRAFGALAATVRWRLVDRDAGLLAIATARCPGAEAISADLTDLDALPLVGARLVTASALLDLASADWLDGLAERLARVGAGFYATLTYDGAMAWYPPLTEDETVRIAFNDHQRRDKGLGAACGPDAAATMADALRRRGYAVRLAPAPWRLRAGALQSALADGIAGAAFESGLDATGWAQARRTASGCTIGHWDLLALLGASAQSKTTSESSP